MSTEKPSKFSESYSQYQKTARALAGGVGHSRSSSASRIDQSHRRMDRPNPLRRTASQSGAAIDKQPSSSLVTEVPKGDDCFLRCRIPWNEKVPAPQIRYPRRDDTYSQFVVPGGPAIVVYPLSKPIRAILDVDRIPDRDLATELPRNLAQLLTNGELLYRSDPISPRLVIKISPNLIVKIRPFLPQDDTTEHTSMNFLTERVPSLPVPKPHGLIHIRKMAYLFMSYIPDPSLETLWPILNRTQKGQVREQLQQYFTMLRHLRPKPLAPLGGLSGEGCADTRGTTRYSSKPTTTASEFTDFLFTHDGNADASYVRFLRSFLPSDEDTRIVFTHGDLRPANILARCEANGSCMVTGIIDWETSGWYPDYFESMKCTNLLTPMGENDWYEYLPPSISPLQNKIRWLVDRVWNRTAGI